MRISAGIFQPPVISAAPVTLTQHDSAATGIILVLGQSLGTGARGTPSIDIVPLDPGDAWMFNGGLRPHHDDPAAQVNLNNAVLPGVLASRVAAIEADYVNPSSDDFGQTVLLPTAREFFATDTRDEAFLCYNGRGAQEYEALALNTSHGGNGLRMMARAAELCPGPVFLAALVFIHGSADSSGGTSLSVYEQNLKTWYEDHMRYARVLFGQTWNAVGIVSQVSNLAFGSLAESQAIALAQLRACQTHPDLYLSGARYTFDHNDNVHLEAIGYQDMGVHVGRTLVAARSGSPVYAMQPAEATLAGSTVSIRFAGVPAEGMVWDTTNIAAKADYGLVPVGANALSHTIVGDTVEIVCDAPPTGVDIGLAMTGAIAGNGFEVGGADSARTNLVENIPWANKPRAACHARIDSFPWAPPAEDAPAPSPTIANHSLTALEQAVADIASTWLQADAANESGGVILDYSKNPLGHHWTNNGAARGTWANGVQHFVFDGTGTSNVEGPEINPCGSDFLMGFVLEYNGGASQYICGSSGNRNNNRWDVFINASRIRFRVVVNNGTSSSLDWASGIPLGSPCGVVIRHEAQTGRIRFWIDGVLSMDTTIDRVNVNTSMALGKNSTNAQPTIEVSDWVVCHRSDDNDQAAIEAYFATRTV